MREARFKFFLNQDGSLSSTPDGGVHDLFVISGRDDAGTCSIRQPDFAHNLTLNNVIFRIPTPVFGAGLIENISDETIMANMEQYERAKEALGISGHPNRDGNDGAIARFGWKAQNKSLEIFAGEAYNVEMGVTNELFQNERASPDEAQRGGLPRECRINPTPEDGTNMTASGDAAVPSDTVQFAMFMRFLAPPAASTTNPGGAASIANGSQVFNAIGCANCHTSALRTSPSAIMPSLVRALPISFPTCSSITWVQILPMASRKAERARTSSAPRLCGDSANASSCFTMAARQTWLTLLKSTPVRDQKLMASSKTSGG